jgi:hypothetical protein
MVTRSGRDVEVLRIVFDDPLGAIIVRYAERVDKCGMSRSEEPPPLGERPSLDHLDPYQRHRPYLRSSLSLRPNVRRDCIPAWTSQ